MLAFPKFKKTVFDCCRIRKSVLYDHRGLFLVAVTSKNRFSFPFCKLSYNFEFSLVVLAVAKNQKTVFDCAVK